MKVLVVVDMQKDFIDGALGTPEAQAIVDPVLELIRTFPGYVVATRDTHAPDYLESEEGRHLPVVHCVRDTAGWQLEPRIEALVDEIIDKPTFGSKALGDRLLAMHAQDPIEAITLVGLCTDICVISNALLLKAYLPEVPMEVVANACAGVSPQSHERALESMRTCQITIRS